LIFPTTFLMQKILAAAQQHVVAGNFSGPLYQPYIGLVTGTFNPSKDTALSAVTEANYTGYARQQIATWGAPYISQDGSAAVDGAPLQFQPSGTIVTTNLISGWFLADAVSTGNYLAGEVISPPVPLQVLTDSLTIVAKIEAPSSAGLGSGLIIA
jgi:hypothetical protein